MRKACRVLGRTILRWARSISGCIRRCGGPSRIRRRLPRLCRPCSASPWKPIPNLRRKMARSRAALIFTLLAGCADTGIAKATSSAVPAGLRWAPRRRQRAVMQRRLRVRPWSSPTKIPRPKLRIPRRKPAMKFIPLRARMGGRITITITIIITTFKGEAPTPRRRRRGRTLPRARGKQTG